MSKQFNNTRYNNTDALEVIQRELQQGIKATIDSLASSDNTPGTFSEMQRRLQENSFFLQNEKADTFKRIDEYSEIYHPDRIARNKQEATKQYNELGAKMVSKAKEEVIALCNAKAANIRSMTVKAPSPEQERLLSVLEKRRGNVSPVEFVNIMSSMYDNYQSLMTLNAIAGDSGVRLSVPPQYDIPKLYGALEEVKSFLLAACNELPKSNRDKDIKYHAFYQMGGDGENDNHHDPHYRELAAMFDTIPQLQDITVTKTALTPTEQVKMDYYFSEVDALKKNETSTETEIMQAVKDVMDAHGGDIELMKLTPYKDYITAIEDAQSGDTGAQADTE